MVLATVQRDAVVSEFQGENRNGVANFEYYTQ